MALLRRIVDCDLARIHRGDDHPDIARWLSQTLGISRWKARRMVVAAYALDHLPLCAEALRSGEISLDKFLELARFVTPLDEAEVLEWAKTAVPVAIRERADRERRITDRELKDTEYQRFVRYAKDDGGQTISLWATFPVADGMVVTSELDRLADQLPSSPEDDAPTIDQRRADALVALCSAALADDADADRVAVVVHTELTDLLAGRGNAETACGHTLHPAVTDMLTCDSRVQLVVRDQDRGVVAIGSPHYLAPRWLRRAVRKRDGHRCTFPGCGQSRLIHIHHIVRWPVGPTQLPNLVSLCRLHHKLVHIFGWRVELLSNGSTRWSRPDGSPYHPGGSPPTAHLPPPEPMPRVPARPAGRSDLAEAWSIMARTMDSAVISLGYDDRRIPEDWGLPPDDWEPIDLDTPLAAIATG